MPVCRFQSSERPLHFNPEITCVVRSFPPCRARRWRHAPGKWLCAEARSCFCRQQHTKTGRGLEGYNC
eukprot:scaffold18789_cov64-Phaeocystis_antarctica.AAC.3